MSDKAANWDEAKKDFKDITGAKKPREKVIGIFKSGHTGLSKSIALLDACDAPGSKYSADDMAKELAKFKGAVANYINTLNAAMAKEPVSDSGEKSTMARGLAALKTRLQSYESFFEMSLASKKKMAEGGNAKEMLRATTAKRISAGCDAATASIAKVSASRTVETYNKEFSGTTGGARVLTTYLKTFKQVDKTDTRADGHIAALAPYSDGAFAQLKAGTPVDEIVAHIKKFAGLVMAVKKDFANV